jgi:osmotically-inducible protein OsmY
MVDRGFPPPTVLRKYVMSQTHTPLNDKVSTALSQNPYLSGRTLRFETEDGRVILRGEVQSYFQKQMAQESLRHVDGVDEIFNELEVTAGASAFLDAVLS